MMEFVLSAAIGATVTLMLLGWREAKRDHAKERQRAAAFEEWSALDKEKTRHFDLLIEARDAGREAEYRWHRLIFNRLEVQVAKAWVDYRNSDAA